jgi:hypothetical protein
MIRPLHKEKRAGTRSDARAIALAMLWRNIFTDSYGIKGDHAGSDASCGVFNSRSLLPVRSMV